jgi:hypothetical protein
MTPENTALFLRAVREIKDFRLKLANTATEIVDKIYSFNTNPNCTCKGAILDWVTKHEDAAANLMTEFADSIKGLPSLPTQPLSQPPQQLSHHLPRPLPPLQPGENEGMKPNIKIGETHTIPASVEEYKKLIELSKTERWIYRGLNIVPIKENDQDKWLILFY